MRLPTTIAGLIFVFCAISLSGKPNQASKVAEQQGSDQPSSPTVTLVNNQASAPDTSRTDDNPRRWYASPEWWLVILGFPTLFFLGVQAVLARKSADAALLNANAIINSERAWLVAKPVIIGGLQPTGKHGALAFKWVITNAGRTPARILETDAVMFRIEYGDLQKLPPEPHYPGSRSVSMNRVVIVPGDSIEVTWLVEDGEEFTKDEVFRIADGKLTMIAHGFVKYLDNFGNARETRFCHHRVPLNEGGEHFQLLVSAPPAYNHSD